MRRIGVFVCHCGFNIAGTVDVEAVAEALRNYPQVSYATTYKYMCSQPGQDLIRQAIAEQNLDGIIVAACSPAMHEATFRKATASAGLSPYVCEIANIREQCSWVHQNQPAEATTKAAAIVRTMVEKVVRDEALAPLTTAVHHRALVIGGGLAGLQAALDIAESGYPVVLVERSDHLGGKVAELSGIYLNFAGGPEVIADRIRAVQEHPRIEVRLSTELASLEGYVGNFRPRLKPAGSSEDGETLEVGAIVVATGFDLFPKHLLGEYGAGHYPDVVSGLDFEKMLAAPEGLRRPSDGRVPREVCLLYTSPSPRDS